MGLGNAATRWFGAATLALALGLRSMPAQADAQSQAVDSATRLASGDAAIEYASGAPGKSVLTGRDEKLLDQIESRGIQFFVDYADPATGLMPDRGKSDGSGPGEIASTASVGFGLTALCVGDYRGWVPHQKAYDLSLKVIHFLRDHGPGEHGYFYHFLDMHTGERAWNCEVSDIDTALLMAGVLMVRQHFPGTDLSKAADDLYERVDWPWMLNGNGLLAMGWNPKVGLYDVTWHDFNEGPLLYLLAMGSSKHPIPAESWKKWKRERVITYAGLTYMQCPPLFTHQYPQVWFDLRGQRDNFADYFRNSQLATLAQREWSINDISREFPDYNANCWGVTASDREGGYDGWGGPPMDAQNKKDTKIDGTVTPQAPAGSLPFEPRLCMDDLESLKAKYGDKAFGKYGFVDAFNPLTGWYDPDVLGIDIGPSVLMAENCRSEYVWKTFMSSPEAHKALMGAGFRPFEASEIPPTTSLVTASQTAGSGG